MSVETKFAGHKRRKETDDDSGSNQSSPGPSIKRNRSDCGSNMSISPTDGAKGQIFKVVITNLPGGWTCDQVMNYIREEIGENALLVNDFRDTESDFQIRLKFKTEEQRNKVLKKLKIKQALGLVCVDTEDPASDEEEYAKNDMMIDEHSDKKGQDVETNISIDVWDVDPKTLYGLKESFLTSLDITPPLSNWVLATNFRCDRSELKEVLELAGHVVVCHVVTVAKRYANVMYSHPLEAVQAISMLNGQTYYGQTLKITMDHQSEYWKILPKGLANLGPGLGKYGKPVRNIAKEYERFLSGKSTFIETKIFKSEKSSDLLKEIILPSITRAAENDDTPKLVIDTENGDEVKEESPKEEIKSNNNSPDSESSKTPELKPSEKALEVNNGDTESLNGEANHTCQSNSTDNKPETSFGQTSGTNGESELPLQLENQGPSDQREISGVGFQGMPDRHFVQGMQTVGGPQTMRGMQGPQNMQRPQSMQNLQGPHIMQGPQGMQRPQGMQGPQCIRGLQGMQRPQVLQGMRGPQTMQGMQGPQTMQGMQGLQAMQGMQGPHTMQGMQGPQIIQGMQGLQSMQGPQSMQGIQGPHTMQGMHRPQTMQRIQGPQTMQGMQGSQNMQGMQGGPRSMQNPFLNRAQIPNNFGNQGPSHQYFPSGNGYLNSGIQGTMQAPNMQPNVPTRPMGPFAQRQSVRPLEIYRGINAYILKIINIPSSVKLSALCDKLSEFGRVTGLELAGPGVATVKYESAGDAERCFRNYRQVFEY